MTDHGISDRIAPLVRDERRWWLVLAASVVLAFFAGLGAYPLFDLDEGAFSQATMEMIASGNYLSTYLDGEPRYDKPIFSYWMQAASVHAFGATEFAFRLPSALAASAWVIAVFAFARTQLSAAAGTAAGLILAFSVGPLIIGRSATADAWLNLWLALTFIDMARWAQAPRTAPLLRAYLWMGLGFLTKGPVAIGIPVLASALYFLLEGRGRDWLRAAFDLRGWAAFAAVALPWYVLILLYEGPGFFYGFFVEHNLQRFTDTREGHGGSLLYYFWAVPLVVSPFAGWLISALGRLRRRPWGLELFCWIWFAVVFVLVSVSGTQLPHYVLYGITPLAIVLAMHRERLRSVGLAFLPALLVLALLLVLPEIIHLGLEQVDDAYDVALLERGLAVFDSGYRLAMGTFLALAVGVMFLVRFAIWQRLLLIGAIQTLALVAVAIPAGAEMQQAPVKRAAEIARERGGPVVAYEINMPSFSVYRGQATPGGMPAPGEMAVTRAHAVDEIAAAHPDHRVTEIYRAGGIVLVRVDRPETTP